MKKLLCVSLLGVLLPAGAAEPLPPLAPVAALDVPRYMGDWYEIAKYPNSFQRKCAGFTKASYKLLDGGRVQVTNSCRQNDGATEVATGLARQLGASDSPRLEVRFAPAWLSFLPFVWGDYWVIDLDNEYQLAAVSEPKREYLWILSRTPSMGRALFERLRDDASDRGYPMEKLIMSAPLQ